VSSGQHPDEDGFEEAPVGNDRLTDGVEYRLTRGGRFLDFHRVVDIHVPGCVVVGNVRSVRALCRRSVRE
jgi:hypothetical protein